MEEEGHGQPTLMQACAESSQVRISEPPALVGKPTGQRAEGSGPGATAVVSLWAHFCIVTGRGYMGIESPSILL